MAYRKRYGKSKKGYKKTYRRKRTSLAYLAYKVKKLYRINKMKTQYQHLGGTVNSTMGSILPPSTAIFNLCNWSSFTPIFGTSGDDVNYANSFYHKSFGIDITIESANETDNISYTCFLVSLKDSVGSAFDPNTGNLTLTNPTHFWTNQGMCMLNKRMFNIHKIKRFNLGNYGQALTISSAQNYGTLRRFFWKWSPKCKVSNPSGSVRNVQTSLDPSKQYYLIVCNDDSSVDGQSPTCRAVVVHTVVANA